MSRDLMRRILQSIRCPSLRLRTAASAAALLAGLGAAAGAQTPTETDTLGIIIRVHRTRSDLTPGVKSTSKRTGMLIRQRGTRQRFDMLDGVSDSVGAEWGTIVEQPFGILLHNMARRTTLSMEFTDLKTLFTDVLHLQIDSLTADAEVLGAGPAVLGYETVHVRFQRQFVMRTRWRNAVQRILVTTTSDEIVASALPSSAGANSLLSMMAGTSASMVETIFGVGAANVRVTGAARLPDGLVLRSVSRSRTVSTGPSISPLFGKGTGESRDSVEVVAVERRPIAAALFDAPTGYAQTSMATQLQNLLTTLDEAGVAGPPPPFPPAGKQSKAGKPIKP
jgi:hypothetical protein